LGGCAWEWGFDGYAAACVEIEQLGELIFGLGSRGQAETSGGGTLGAEVGVGGDEFEEIESDVFRAARGGGAVAGVHKSLSKHVAKGDGSGLAEMVATWDWMRGGRRVRKRRRNEG
jgi:hypothetical protein